MPELNFTERVNRVVSTIPTGKVMAYGQIAALCGNARAARIVGGVAHYGDQTLPWHRVVNKRGGMASGYPGGRAAQAAHLRTEGLLVSEQYYIQAIEVNLWRP